MTRLGPAALVILSAALAPAAPAGAADEPQPAKEGSAPSEFVVLEEIRTPIIDSGAIAGTIRIRLAVQAQDAATAQILMTKLPSIRAVALAAVLDFANLQASGFRAVNAAKLQVELTEAVRKAAPGIRQVLILEAGTYPA